MLDIETALAANKDAVADLVAAAEKSEQTWTVPRAPGKWSPSQVVEHVARSMDESANVLAGQPSKFPNLPFFLRPLIRGFLFNRTLKNNAFPKAKTSKPFQPITGPATPAEARQRLEASLARFDDSCRGCSKSRTTIATATFGTVSVVDYARFNELHIRHHRKQMS